MKGSSYYNYSFTYKEEESEDLQTYDEYQRNTNIMHMQEINDLIGKIKGGSLKEIDKKTLLKNIIIHLITQS